MPGHRLRVLDKDPRPVVGHKSSHTFDRVDLITNKLSPRVPHGASRLRRAGFAPGWVPFWRRKPEPRERRAKRELFRVRTPVVERTTSAMGLGAAAAGSAAALTAAVVAQDRRRFAVAAACAAALQLLDAWYPTVAAGVTAALLVLWTGLEYARLGRPPNRAVPVAELAVAAIPGFGLAAIVLGQMLKAGRDTAEVGAWAMAGGKACAILGLAVLPGVGLWRTVLAAGLAVEIAVAPTSVCAASIVMVLIVPGIVARGAAAVGHLLAVVAIVAAALAGWFLGPPPLVPTAAFGIATHIDAALWGV